MLHALEELVISLADILPLPVFAAVSSFVEEIIAPIPSGPVMLVMGSLAQVQGYTLLMLFGLAVVAAFGKLLGALVVYVIADKAEDILAGRLGSLIGVTHAQIESFGQRLGNGWKDYVLLTVLRMLPFVPSAVISAGSGVLKIPLRLFIFSTFIGSIVRDAFFLYAGYAGLEVAGMLLARFKTIETLLLGLLVCITLGILAYLYLKHRAQKSS